MAAAKGNQYAKGNKGGGRPSKFKPEMVERVYHLALLGMNDAQLAAALEIGETTLNEYKKEQEFSEAIKAGKEIADSKVANSLYRRANGYSHDAVKIVVDAKTGAVTKVDYTEHYPPDVEAAKFWLKNRQPGMWRERVEVDNTHRLAGLSDAQLDEELRKLRDKAQQSA